MCLKRKGVTWIFILRLNKGNKQRHISENQYTGSNKYKITFKVGHMTEKLK